MTTEEVYFKIKEIATLPIARCYYTLKDNKGVIQLWGGCIDIIFNDGFDNNTTNMKLAEANEGFMFWNASDEGVDFYKNNWSVISEGLTNMVLNNK